MCKESLSINLKVTQLLKSMDQTILEKLAYDSKYTLGTYADLAMSVPIGASQYICKGIEKICKDKTPEFFNWNKITQESPTYKIRKNLRTKLDTEPGVKFIQSCLLGLAPFILIGMPVAEGTEKFIGKYFPKMPELAKCLSNSIATIGAQMITGYTTFMVNEIRTNKHKYQNEKGKLNMKKLSKGLKNTIKTFLKFDLSYTAGKSGLQTYFLMKGKDPWKASGIADAIATPLFYLVSIPLGLHNGIIETKKTKKQNSLH